MHAPIPWIGLAAIVCMFVLPWLDARGLFDGPRTIRHRPPRHVCADCGAVWTRGHHCAAGWLAAAEREPVAPLGEVEPPTTRARVRVQLTRTDQPDRPALPPRKRHP